ncbi:hypothetical protein EN836_28585 [Mesorhizobium sp. M1C.F.Ca.ET.193.01.1.1]|uniref:hypothetical protein n=1 Tax=unclassified Mesorhizobium TaxID=325217 RepID=UPI000FD20340|nr:MULTISPECIES: hypothetical protein [unclassified Mesorhizobium]TGS93043.1 hypothetical protein EN820_49245 [bacterium M00.F.Ca.ET.177.01.1.1]TGQ50566.1 hypothetical protein EN853_28575 [Mesorhizobium sp. M1C.F.Ca.ET.210.01.1.1]TGQ65741.1 hypothetical protein EN855_028590 [Mesorhizobium sp. M1C.F.Ca.ET.212.01.1.1]TGQ99471.1 hypothetical protein EN847_28575 [Mesorhizobium sp. M1C.F.Ca.ET.204.01.1.1]TGR19876.1 hypothetical protein EN839_28575 [Mesorhizobium sp. M1C.F.Ca.ET.196.01.1.1]
MRRIIAYLVRFAAILIGYAIASLAASAFLNVLFLGYFGYAPEPGHPTIAPALYFSVPFVALFVAYFGFMPATVVILIAEVLGRRDWLFYALGGAVIAVVFLGFAHNLGDGDFDVANNNVRLALIGSGMVGGIFYWLCAGRWAGAWRREPLPDLES